MRRFKRHIRISRSHPSLLSITKGSHKTDPREASAASFYLTPPVPLLVPPKPALPSLLPLSCHLLNSLGKRTQFAHLMSDHLLLPLSQQRWLLPRHRASHFKVHNAAQALDHNDVCAAQQCNYKLHLQHCSPAAPLVHGSNQHICTCLSINSQGRQDHLCVVAFLPSFI